MKTAFQPDLPLEESDGVDDVSGRFLAAEFFAGIGLVRKAIEAEGFRVVFANDIQANKRRVYKANFPGDEFVLADVRDISATDIPAVDLATASFPCTDLSVAGNRAGLKGKESGLFWEFARIIEEMDPRPSAVLLENVPGLVTSNGGADLKAVLKTLNSLGYFCDVFSADASWFVPQSRSRVFIVGSVQRIQSTSPSVSEVRPPRLVDFLRGAPELILQSKDLFKPSLAVGTLADVAEQLDDSDPRWWGATRLDAFVSSLSPIQKSRLNLLLGSHHPAWVAAYRRTRGGRPVWEIRPDFISGCLRTARGGSSKQAIVQVAKGKVRARWMTPREYARLQGAPDDFRLDAVTPGQGLFGLGDAVCIPVIRWIAKTYLLPLLEGIERPMELAGFRNG